MVAFENNLLVFFLVALVVALIAGLGYALWQPVLRRAWRYFRVWWERDKIAEAEARRVRECREQAEREIGTACGEDLHASTETATATEPEHATRQDTVSPPTVAVPLQRNEQR